MAGIGRKLPFAMPRSKLPPTALESALEALYATFSRYNGTHLEGCPHCVSFQDSAALRRAPLRQLGGELHPYLFKAMTTWGTEEDFKHFVPRLLDLYAWSTDAWLLCDKLLYARWRSWAEPEQRAVEGYLLALWRERLAADEAPLPGDVLLETMVTLDLDLAPYDLRTRLEAWRSEGSRESVRSLARFVLDHPEWVRDRRVVDLGTGSGVAAIVAVNDGKAAFAAAVTDDLVGRVSAVDLVRAAFAAAGADEGASAVDDVADVLAIDAAVRGRVEAARQPAKPVAEQDQLLAQHLHAQPPFPLETDTTWDTDLEQAVLWGLRILDKNRGILTLIEEGSEPDGSRFLVHELGTLRRGLALRDEKAKWLGIALPLFVLGFALYVAAIAQLLALA